MMYEQLTEGFSKESKDLVASAEKVARRFNHQYVGTEHLLMTLLERPADLIVQALKTVGIDGDDIRRSVEDTMNKLPDADDRPLPVSPRAKTWFRNARSEAFLLKSDSVKPEHLLLGLYHDEFCQWSQLLKNCGFSYEKVREEVVRLTL